MKFFNLIGRYGGPLGLIVLAQVGMALSNAQSKPDTKVANQSNNVNLALSEGIGPVQPENMEDEKTVKDAIVDLALARCAHYRREGINLIEHEIALHGKMTQIQSIGDNGQGIQGSATANQKTAPLLVDQLALELCRKGQGRSDSDYRYTMEGLIYEH